MLLEMLPGPSKQTANTVQRLPAQSSSSEPDLYTQAHIPPGDDAWRNDYYYISFAISLNISLPLCSKKEKKSGELFSD